MVNTTNCNTKEKRRWKGASPANERSTNKVDWLGGKEVQPKEQDWLLENVSDQHFSNKGELTSS